MPRQVPSNLRVDVATACQLRCPTCPTALGEISRQLGGRFMSVENFRKLLSDHPEVNDVELSNWGEILLNPDLPAILEWAHSQGIRVHADNGVNFNHVKRETLEAIIKYQLYSITCSIDGCSNETYEQYRVRGNFDTVIRNIQTLNEIKARNNSPYPLLLWQFVVFSHNQHEIEMARELANSLNMRFYAKPSWDDLYTEEAFHPVIDKESVRLNSDFGVANREEYEQRNNQPFLQQKICSQLWLSPQINWDGRVLGCCVNFWGSFGNALDDGLAAALNSPSLEYARGMLLGKLPPKDGIPCTTCSFYTTIAERGQWLSRRYLLARRLELWLRRHTDINRLRLRQNLLALRSTLKRLASKSRALVQGAPPVDRSKSE